MSKWYEMPTKTLSIKDDIHYIMCIDENGNSDLNYILKQLSNDKELSNDERYFTITGCIFTKEEYFNSKDMINELKNKYWENGMFYNNKLKQNKAVCLHSRDIRKYNDSFNDSVINYNDFIIDLTETMKNIKCKII